MTDDKKMIPMDSTMPEGDYTPMVNNPRNTYAMDQLITELEHLFPGIGYEVSARNQRGVAFDIQFDTSTVLEEDRDDFTTLLTLLGDAAYNRDVRLLGVVADPEGVLISFRNSPTIMDDRSPFGLPEAWNIIRGNES